MKQLNFTPGNFTQPAEIPRQVDALARDVERAFRRLPQFYMPLLTPVKPAENPYTAHLGEMIFVDAAAGARTVVLPQPPGGIVSVIGVVSANLGVYGIAVTAANSTVNGVASFDLPFGNRLTLFLSDGTNWWGTGG